MNGDSAIVSHLPEVVTMLQQEALKVAGAGLASYLTYRALKRVAVWRRVRALRLENAAQLQQQTARIQQLVASCGMTGDQLEAITQLDWDQLVTQLADGQLTPTQVLRAYQAAAVELSLRTNCVVAWLEDAEAEAARLEAVAADQRGPLHGVPVSVKECYDVAGTASTAGMAAFARNTATKDCPLVQLIRSLGGIPFCKTNVPQTMMSLQCSNPLYGTSTNPHSRPGWPRECGGSSGGEGVIVGGGGSVLGLGSDIGGSLRSPVAFCGGYSLKPTVGRHLSQLGVVAPTSAEPVGVRVTGGFMTRSARALEAAWRLVWSLAPEDNPMARDTSLVPLGWRQQLYERKVRLGYFTQPAPGLVPPASGCVRAVMEAKARLEAAGYTLVEIPAPDVHQVLYYFNGLVMADQNASLYANLRWDEYDSTLSGMVAAMTLYKCPTIIKKFILNPIISLLTRVPPIARLFTTAPELMAALEGRDRFVRSYLATLEAAGVEAVLCPGQMLPAPPTHVLGTMVAGILPYIPWNLMNFPAGIAPVTTWTKEDQQEMEASYPRDDLVTRMIGGYCDEGALGMPLSVQLVARPYCDEVVLKLLSLLGTDTAS